jgi:hypothetical protein
VLAVTTETRYELHGVRIRVTGPGEATKRFWQRLSSFKRDYEGCPDIDFTLTTDESSPESTSPRRGRSIYELEGGEVLYHSDTGALTASYGDCVYMMCDLSSGHAEYRLSENEQAYRTASHILFTLPLIELLRRRGLYNIHAAGLCRGGDAVLLAGASGAGKSTLTLVMSQAGWDYMGDDMLFLKPGCADVFGFPEGIDYFPDFGSNSRKVHVRPEAAFGNAEVLQAKPRALIFPRVAHTQESLLLPMNRAAAFLELAPNVLMSDRAACETHFKVLEDLTRRVPAFRLHTGKDLAQAERTIRHVLT